MQTIDGKPLKPQIHSIAWDPVSAEKGEYRHFMQKEIHEQVRSLTDTLAGRVDFEEGKVFLNQLNLDAEQAKKIQKIYITACGTAAYAGMVGKIYLERIARISDRVGDCLRVSLSTTRLWMKTRLYWPSANSGETADTLAAMDEGPQTSARSCGRSLTPLDRRRCG